MVNQSLTKKYEKLFILHRWFCSLRISNNFWTLGVSMEKSWFYEGEIVLTLQAPTSQNRQTHSNSLLLTNCLSVPTNCLSVFDHFVGLVPKGLMHTLNLKYKKEFDQRKNTTNTKQKMKFSIKAS